MKRIIIISETLSTRIGNSFLKNEDSFFVTNVEDSSSGKMFNCKCYEKNPNFRNSRHKNREFLFSRTKVLFGRQFNRKLFWKECLIANLV